MHIIMTVLFMDIPQLARKLTMTLYVSIGHKHTPGLLQSCSCEGYEQDCTLRHTIKPYTVRQGAYTYGYFHTLGVPTSTLASWLQTTT